MNIKECKKWIKKNKENFLYDCNEYNHTAMAEAMAEKFNLYVDKVNYMIPDEVFDLVVEEV